MPSAKKAKTAVDIYHLRELAKKRLPKAMFTALDHGSEDDVAYHHNRAVADRIKLVNRIFRDTTQRDPSITLFGKEHGLPLIIGPTGPTSWVSYRGELALARAAAKENIPFTMSSLSDTPMDVVRWVGGGTQFYQSVIFSDTDAWLRGITRARDAGFEALFLTMDSTMGYNRPHDNRNRLKFPMNVRPGQLLESARHPRWTFGGPVRYLLNQRSLPRMTNIAFPEGLSKAEKAKFFAAKDQSLTWDFLSTVREVWPQKLIVKGIMHPEDAVLAVEHGADAIVVSNHGGGTNDAAPSPLEMLPGVAAAVAGRVPILVDSGFRRGTDVIKALALGATAVMLGRATLYGLGAGGQDGAERALAIFRSEIMRMMSVLGVSSLSELGRDHVVLPGDLDHLARRSVPWKGPEVDLAAAVDAGATVS